MPLDALCLSGLVSELKSTLVGGKIDKIYQPSRDEIILALRTSTGNVEICAPPLSMVTCNLVLPATAHTCGARQTVRVSPFTEYAGE